VVLVKAERGDIEAGILDTRKAGAAFAKAFVKDSLVGLKNPVKRLRRQLADSSTVDTIGQELFTTATQALQAYNAATDELVQLGTLAEHWVTATVTQGVNTMFTARDTVVEKVEDVCRALAATESCIADAGKARQASARKKRLDTRRILKVFNGSVPHHWRMALHEAGLSIDEDDPLWQQEDDPKNFANYSPTKPSFSAEFAGGIDQWDIAKWYAPTDEGAQL